jgi:hypothetical protein
MTGVARSIIPGLRSETWGTRTRRTLRRSMYEEYEGKNDQPVVSVTLTDATVWKIVFAVVMGNLLTGAIIGVAYALNHIH